MSLEDKIQAYLASLSGGSVGSEKDEFTVANSVDTSSDTTKSYADGGMIDEAKDGPIIEDSTLEGFAKLMREAAARRDATVDTSTGTAKGYAMGGNVTDQDKNKAVMSAMGIPAMQGDLPVDGSGNYAVASGNGTLQAPPQAVSAPPPAPAPAPVAAAPQAPVSAPAAPAAPASNRPPVQDLLNKLTDNDSDKMNALIASLHDRDKRGAFAQALAVIGDTFGNMGRAKAGQSPDGFQGLKAVQGVTDETRKRMIDEMPMKLAADPHSQTSRLAQQTLMQAMNIGPNDPRAKSIMNMPAQTIVQQMPQLNDAIKSNLEREKNQLEHDQLQSAIKDREASLQIAGMNAQTQMQKDRGDLAANIAKETSIFNPQHYAAQRAALSSAGVSQSTPQPHPQDAAAVNWAHTHMNDPRAKQILQANGL